MRVDLNCYPGGKKKALTMSYDDGREYDRKLVEIFNQYGIKGSFHLNSGFLDTHSYLESKEIATLFGGHEISCHTVTHPHLTNIPFGSIMSELLPDRQNLEKLAGYPVRGMSYPYGTYNDKVVSCLPAAGIEYARTVYSHGGFHIPQNFHKWDPTCHHNADIMEKYKSFQSLPAWLPLPLFYIWGHSYEFHDQKNWHMIEEFCKTVSGDPDVWFATNIEIVDYLNALSQLKFSVDQHTVLNISNMLVWVLVDGQPVEIKPGLTVI